MAAFAVCGILLFSPFARPSFAAQPPQALTIVSAMPQEEVKKLTQITVRFSEAMRPLGVMEQKAASSPLHLSVPGGKLPAGNYRWIDPATLAYLFDQPVEGPVHIEAFVPAEVTALSGASLAAEKRWNVTTPEIAITCNTKSGDPLPPKDGAISLSSNYPLRLDDLKTKTRLEMDGKSLPVEWRQEGYSYYAGQLKNDLPPGKTLVLTLAAGIRPEKGFVPSKEFRFALASYGPLTVNRLTTDSYTSGPEKLTRPGAGSGLHIRLSNPVKRTDLLAHLSVSPAAGTPDSSYHEDEARKKDWLEQPDRDVSFRFAWQPRSNYTVTVRTGLKDVYGGVLEKDAVYNFTVGDYEPSFSLPDGEVLEAKLGGILPFFVRNFSPIALHLRFLPWGDDPAAVFADNASGPSSVQGAIDKKLLLTFAPNEIIRHTLNLPETLGRAATNGLIRLTFAVSRLGGGDDDEKTRTYTRTLQVTDIGLSVKNGRTGGLAWATSLSGGDALAGAKLSLHAEKKGLLWQGVTDAKGMATLPGSDTLPPGERAWLRAEHSGDTAVLALDSRNLSATFGDYDNFPEKNRPWKVHLVSQLPLYQPGQTVRFILYAKAYSAGKAEQRLDVGEWQPLPAGRGVSYIICDQQGKEVFRGEGVVNAYGSLTGQFTLSEEATLGQYTVITRTPGIERASHGRAFKVASFRPPDFKVDVADPATQPVPGRGENALGAVVTAGYFSGAALPGAQTTLAVTGREGSFAPASLYGYAVGSNWRHPRFGHGLPYHYNRARQIAALNAVMDGAGKASFTLPAIPVQPGRVEEIGLEATVADASGLTSQGTAAFTLHPSAAYVGIKAPYFTPAGKELRLELKAASFDDKPLPGAQVRLTAERRIEQDKFDSPVFDKSVSLGAAEGGKAAFTPAKGGVYRIRAEIADAKGRKNLSELFLYVTGPGLTWDRTDARTLELMPDEKAYAPGATARIVVKNPLADEGEKTQALVTTERGGVREARVMELTGPAPVIEVPLAEKDVPYVYVSVVLIRGRTAPPPDGERSFGPDSGAPQVRVGVARLDVTGPPAFLTATVATDAPKYRPGGKVTATVTVRDAAGKGRKAQVTLLAVDNRVLRAAGEQNNYYPGHSFQPLYSHGVSTLDIRSLLVNLGAQDLKVLNEQTRRSALYAPSPMGMAAAEAAQGGTDGEPPLRENFRPDAFWLAQAETDESGALQAEFTLPDSLTSYRIVAIAADAGKEFALAQTDITATKPLQLLSALPRFAVAGDTLFARILVQNLSEDAGEITVTAKAEGMALTAEKSRSIRLEAGKSGIVSFPLRMGDVGTGTLHVKGAMTAKGAKENDAATFRLPVLPAQPLTTVAAAGLLHADKTYTLPVNLPEKLDGRSRLEVVFAPSPAAGLPLAAQSLLDYPWHCLEQRLSRIWVRALRLKHGDLIGLPADPADKEMIKKTMLAVPKFQKNDGGFSLWAESAHSDPYLTAYVLLVNKQLEGLDAALDSKVADQAVRFLAQALRAAPKTRTPDLRAVALWVLSLHKGNENDVRALFPALLKEKGKNPLGLAAMMLTAANMPDLKDKEAVIAGLLAELEKTAAVTAAQVHFAPQNPEWCLYTLGSTLRDNGLVLWALTKAKPDYPRLEALAHWVSQGLGEKKILSTQEAMFGLMGLTAYLEHLGGNRPTTLKALWNGKESMSKSFEKLIDPPQTWVLPADKLPDGAKTTLVLAADKGSPYWAARLSYAAPQTGAKGRNAGLTLTRAWSKTGPYRVGDTVTVTLTLTVPATRRHVLLFDPFPAGLEPLHATRADLQAEDLRQRYPYPWQRTELRDSGLLLYTEQVEPGTYAYTYTLRATTPGAFTRPPALAEEMYTPEVFGRTAVERVEVAE